MSEPNAGSDLASLSTRAVRQGDVYVVNGQKVWTSGAHDSDFCMCFVRTDTEAPKHRGISVLIIDMKTPGITCRPLPELTDPDHADFNEVFFSDVEVPVNQRLGEENRGWAVSQGSLRHERGMLWISNVTSLERTVDGLVRLGRQPDGAGGVYGDDPTFAHDVARLAIDAQALRCLGYRGFAKATRGEMPAEHMMLKLFSSETERTACALGSEVQGAGALDIDGAGPSRFTEADVAAGAEVPEIDPGILNHFDSGSWAVQYLWSFAGTIAGGTSEIQRNILAERVLGLPR
jgi:alkylation response protein AidB-like acyl-CoA dehydrogenase